MACQRELYWKLIGERLKKALLLDRSGCREGEDGKRKCGRGTVGKFVGDRQVTCTGRRTRCIDSEMVSAASCRVSLPRQGWISTRHGE